MKNGKGKDDGEGGLVQRERWEKVFLNALPFNERSSENLKIYTIKTGPQVRSGVGVSIHALSSSCLSFLFLFPYPISGGWVWFLWKIYPFQGVEANPVSELWGDQVPGAGLHPALVLRLSQASAPQEDAAGLHHPGRDQLWQGAVWPGPEVREAGAQLLLHGGVHGRDGGDGDLGDAGQLRPGRGRWLLSGFHLQVYTLLPVQHNSFFFRSWVILYRSGFNLQHFNWLKSSMPTWIKKCHLWFEYLSLPLVYDMIMYVFSTM